MSYLWQLIPSAALCIHQHDSCTETALNSSPRWKATLPVSRSPSEVGFLIKRRCSAYILLSMLRRVAWVRPPNTSRPAPLPQHPCTHTESTTVATQHAPVAFQLYSPQPSSCPEDTHTAVGVGLDLCYSRSLRGEKLLNK